MVQYILRVPKGSVKDLGVRQMWVSRSGRGTEDNFTDTVLSVKSFGGRSVDGGPVLTL